VTETSHVVMSLCIYLPRYFPVRLSHYVPPTFLRKATHQYREKKKGKARNFWWYKEATRFSVISVTSVTWFFRNHSSFLIM